MFLIFSVNCSFVAVDHTKDDKNLKKKSYDIKKILEEIIVKQDWLKKKHSNLFHILFIPFPEQFVYIEQMLWDIEIIL